MGLTLEELQRRATGEYNNLKRRKRELYHLAKELGFTPNEAKILSGSTQEKIVELAKKRTVPSP